MERASFTWKDGVWVEGNQPMLGPMSHAWWMASSVFDGARSFQRLVPDLDRHCARIIESGKSFGMTAPLTADEIVALAWEGIEKFPEDAELYIRPMMYFEDGFVAPDVESTQFILTVFEAPMPAWGGIKTMVSSYRRPTPEAAPTNAKASCLYPNVARAMMEARQKGFGTAVVLDAMGNVAEFATNNLFIVRDGVVQTPAANGAFLSGLTRRRIMELLSEDGRDVAEMTLTLDDLAAADEVFLTGNYSKIQPVIQVADTHYQIGPVATRARELYFDFAKREGCKEDLMEDQNQVGRDHWKGRSSGWTATAAQGLSTDDTLNQMLIEHTGIKSGERVLDIGSGTGDPAISIGLALGSDGGITACDLTSEMLAKARERSVNVGLDIISFAAADMSSLTFGDNSFDCITCRFGLMFPENKVAAASEALRVLKPGGRVGYMVWGPYEENPPFFVIRRAIAEAFGEEEGPVPHRHSLSQPGVLTGILDAAGFENTEEREIRYKRPADDLDDYINRALIRGYADTVAKLSDGARDKLMVTLRAAFDPYREDGPDGHMVYMPNSARLGLGWKSA